MALERFGQYAELITQLTAVEGEDQQRPLVGAIVYGKGKKIVGIGVNTEVVSGPKKSTFEERLFSKYLETPGDFNADAFDASSNRVLGLPQFDELFVAQVDIGHQVDIKAYESLRTRPTVTVNIAYSDPANPEKPREKFHMDEEDVLKLLTGEQGGIAMFYGMNREEDDAFIFEKDVAGQKHGYVFFVHPTDEPSLGFNSIMGVRMFLETLNDQFTQKAPQPLQDQVLSVFEAEVKKGTLKFSSQVRAELFKAMIIANARMADLTGDAKYQAMLEKCLPGLRDGLIMNVRRALGGVGFDAAMRDKNVQAILDGVIGRIANPEKEAQSAKKTYDETVLGKLQGDRARVLRRDVIGSLWTRDPQMRLYLNELAIFAEEARSEADFDDVLVLLDEVVNLTFRNGMFAGGRNYLRYVGWKPMVSGKRERFEFPSGPGPFEIGFGANTEHYGRDGIKILIAKTRAHKYTRLSGVEEDTRPAMDKISNQTLKEWRKNLEGYTGSINKPLETYCNLLLDTILSPTVEEPLLLEVEILLDEAMEFPCSGSLVDLRINNVNTESGYRVHLIGRDGGPTESVPFTDAVKGLKKRLDAKKQQLRAEQMRKGASS